MNTEIIFDEILANIKEKNIKNKKLLEIVKILKAFRKEINKSIEINILTKSDPEYKKFIGYVTIFNNKYFKIMMNLRYEYYYIYLPYVLLHELLHIALFHFFKENIYDSHLMNIIKDIEVNTYIDLLTDYVPDIHSMYYFQIAHGVNIRDYDSERKERRRKALTFFSYLISLNYLEKRGGLINFQRNILSFLTNEQAQHWLEFQRKRKQGLISYNDIIKEAEYWFDTRNLPLYLNNIFEKFDSFDNISYNSPTSVNKKAIPQKILPKYNKILNDLKKYLSNSDSIHKNTKNVYVRSVLPMHLSRKNYAELSQNINPIFFENIKKGNAFTRKSLYIYIDVSGSMFEYIGYAMQLIKFFADMNPQIYIFSNEVQKYDLKKFINGDYTTSFGTFIDPVLNHITDNKVENAIIISDMLWTVKLKKTIKKLNESNSKIHFISLFPENAVFSGLYRVKKILFIRAKKCVGKYYEINVKGE